MIKALKVSGSPSWQPISCSKAKEEKCLCLLKNAAINDVGVLFFLYLLLSMVALYDEGWMLGLNMDTTKEKYMS